MNYVKRILFVVASAFSLCSCCCGQSGFDSIGRVETVGGAGTGFVAARDGKESFEVWTAGHVVDRVGQNVAIRFEVGEQTEKLYAGKVIARDVAGGRDVAKIRVDGEWPGIVLKISDEAGASNAYTAGYSSGKRFRRLRTTEAFRGIPDRFRGWIPKSVPGESGSPVWDESGVIGVVYGHTMNVPQRMLSNPISDWR